MPLSNDFLERLSRQTQLRELGVEKLQRIADTRFLVIGAGGLGCPAIQYLATAGARHLCVADADIVSLSNLSRQLLHTDARIGMNKADSAALAVASMTPHCRVEAVSEMAVGETLDRLVREADIVLDCCDNLATRMAINRAAHRHRKPVVFGSAIRFDAQITVFDHRRNDAPCYECVFEPDDAANDVKASAVGVFSPLTGVAGVLMASEAIKLAADLPTELIGRFLFMDLAGPRFEFIRYGKRRDCPVCGSRH